MYAGTGSSPRIAHLSLEYAYHLAMVRAGLAVALVPRQGRSPTEGELRAVPVLDPVPTPQVVAVHRRSMADSPALSAVLAALGRP